MQGRFKLFRCLIPVVLKRVLSLTVIALLTAVFLPACEDVVNLQLDEGDPLLVVDAFLNDARRVQTIRLSKSVPYLSDESAPDISGASVSVVELQSGREYRFRETAAGVYQRWPRRSDVFGETRSEEHTSEIQSLMRNSYAAICLTKIKH